MDVAQGVHDALDLNASQRPAAKREVESLTRDVECFGGVRAEPNPATLLRRQRSLSRVEILLMRVEGIDGRVSRCRKRGQAAIATADVQNTFAAKGDEMLDRGSFDASLVTPIHAVRAKA